MELVCVKNQGIGLSAVQVGVPYNLFLINDSKIEYFVNCSYTGLSNDKIISVEGCLSLPLMAGNQKIGYRQFEVERYKQVEITGQQLIVGKELRLQDFKEVCGGIRAVVFQHEIDHANSILITKGKEIFKIC